MNEPSISLKHTIGDGRCSRGWECSRSQCAVDVNQVLVSFELEKAIEENDSECLGHRGVFSEGIAKSGC
jgi:hypothetical protein